MVMVFLSAALLVAVSLTVAAFIKTNIGPDGCFRFGPVNFVRLLGISIAPAIVAWVMWRYVRKGRWRLVPVPVIWVATGIAWNLATNAITRMRPLVHAEHYDQAIAKIVAEVREISGADPNRTVMMKSLRPRLQAMKDDSDRQSLVKECDTLIEQLQSDTRRAHEWPDFVRRNFQAEGVSAKRAEEYLFQVLPTLPIAELIAVNEEILQKLQSIREAALQRELGRTDK